MRNILPLQAKFQIEVSIKVMVIKFKMSNLVS